MKRICEPGAALNPLFEKCGGPLCEFVDPGAEYLLFSAVVNDVNVRFAENGKEYTLLSTTKH